MEKLIKELETIINTLEPISKEMENEKIKKPLEKLMDAANKVGKSWSNSFLGYQSRVYYRNFKEPPTGEHFSIEWGFINSLSVGTIGDWIEYKFEDVINHIENIAGNPDLTYFQEKSDEAKELFNEHRADILSVLAIVNKNISDNFINEKIKKLKEYKIFTSQELAKSMCPNGGEFISRDMVAMEQGIKLPPHIKVKTNLLAISMPIQLCKSILEDSKIILKHISRLNTSNKYIMNKKGNTIFIGHGHSLIWLQLDKFLKDTLKLDCEEYNSVPTAGTTPKERLEEMLDNASFAFIVMTAEDGQKDGSIRARENVVHEAGLFQGRLGFKKAIVLLEEGCQEFSNIQGLSEIRFPKEKLDSKFEEIRRVLEREKIINK